VHIKNKMTKTTYALESKKRSDERRQDLIANRQIPAIVYGPNIKENEKISIDYSDFIRLYRQTGQNKIIDLKTEKSTIKVLVQTVQQHPVSDDFIHIDFYAIDPSKKILVNIPLVFHGESNAVKNLNADLNLSIEILEIRCPAADIPEELQVDISTMENIGDTVTVGDLKLPSKMELVHFSESDVICSVPAHKEVKTEESAVAEVEEKSADVES